ncbi:MAG: tyrosine-protein phosphatase [Anaerolineales bacterium]
MFEEIYFERQNVEQYIQARERRLPFAGAKNFRDLGGYQTTDARTIRWGKLYRSDSLHKLTPADLKRLTSLSLDRIIDFRADHEIAEEPDRLPAGTESRVVRISILDSSTQIWRDSREQFIKGNLQNVDPVHFMIQTNMDLGTRFTPQMQTFVQEVLSANGYPLLFHCAAGKDRTGFAAAILLRILGIPQPAVMEDYLLSNQYYLSAHKWNLTLLQLAKGKSFASVVKGFLEVRPAYLATAFEAIDYKYGSFKYYVRNELGLTLKDIEQLKMLYLE